ncbi:MAG: polyprenyl synthetase family protein [Alphaproteobacteria bacterium]
MTEGQVIGAPATTTRSAQGSSQLVRALSQAASAVDLELARVLPEPHGLHARIQEAMRYAITAGGKRLRPFLVIESAKLFNVDPAYALRAAAAIELVHTYSLVHDDLPCMDDDDLRRGQPTVHVAFDEATAVLVGDALLTIAFEVLASEKTHPSAEVRCQLIARLAEASGSNGMIGGQMIDMEAPNQSLSADSIILLQRMKTGALFEFACEAGAILAQAGHEHRERLRGYARDFGLVFQITDDLLDALSTAEKAGKAVGKDQEQGKATLISAFGVSGARSKAEQLARRAAEALVPYGTTAAALQELPIYLLDRQS